MFHKPKDGTRPGAVFFVPNEKINVYRKKSLDKRRCLCYLEFNDKR